VSIPLTCCPLCRCLYDEGSNAESLHERFAPCRGCLRRCRHARKYRHSGGVTKAKHLAREKAVSIKALVEFDL